MSRRGLTDEQASRLAEFIDERDKHNADAWTAFWAARGMQLSREVACAVTGEPLPHFKDSEHPDDTSAWDTARIQGEMRKGGEAVVVNFGFGSRHDGDRYLIGISDGAIESLVASGRAVLLGSYMGLPVTDEPAGKE